MKNFILLSFSLFAMNICSAHEASPEGPDYQVISSKIDSTIPANKSMFEFYVNGLHNIPSPIAIVYSINDVIDTVFINDKRRIYRMADPGVYKFEFFYNTKYHEIFIHKLEIQPGYRTIVQLNFKPVERQDGEMKVKKPVIYLYPEVPTLVEVKVEPKGEMSFTYPEYKNGWTVEAKPNGDLTVDSKTLNYLFWEADQQLFISDFNFSQASIITKENSISFLEEKLTEFGMNSKEQADFITFWGPQLMKNESNIVHFVINEDSDQFGDLSIVPAPSKIYRIYLIFTDAQNVEITELHEQILPKMDRSGFIALEWGGVELTSEPNP